MNRIESAQHFSNKVSRADEKIVIFCERIINQKRVSVPPSLPPSFPPSLIPSLFLSIYVAPSSSPPILPLSLCLCVWKMCFSVCDKVIAATAIGRTICQWQDQKRPNLYCCCSLTTCEDKIGYLSHLLIWNCLNISLSLSLFNICPFVVLVSFIVCLLIS